MIRFDMTVQQRAVLVSALENSVRELNNAHERTADTGAREVLQGTIAVYTDLKATLAALPTG